MRDVDVGKMRERFVNGEVVELKLGRFVVLVVVVNRVLWLILDRRRCRRVVKVNVSRDGRRVREVVREVDEWMRNVERRM